MFFFVEAANAAELREQLFEGNLKGLRASGFDGDENLVRLGFRTPVVCKFVDALTIRSIYRLADPATASQWEAIKGLPILKVIAAHSEVVRIVTVLADEARALMDELGW